jgi:aryl-alcohol dehydrogenase-like predicted oxidoreductase
MNFFDVADVYCAGEDDIGYSERLLARAIREWRGRRDAVRISTKGGGLRPGGGWKICGRPEQLRASCDASLRALGVPSIFLYQLHRTDPCVPLAESLGALVELKREGKIQHIGLSNTDGAQFRLARRVAGEIASVQNGCSPFDRGDLGNGVLEACERYGAAYVAFGPVGGYQGHGRVTNDLTLRRVGARHGVSPQQVAIAWVLARSPNVVAIPSASRVASVLASAAAADLELTAEDRADLDAAFPPPSFAAARMERMNREARHVARDLRARIRYGFSRRSGAERDTPRV